MTIFKTSVKRISAAMPSSASSRSHAQALVVVERYAHVDRDALGARGCLRELVLLTKVVEQTIARLLLGVAQRGEIDHADAVALDAPCA